MSGALITTFTLVMASTKVGKKGASKSMNQWLRARVVAQGATIAVCIGGAYGYGRTNKQKIAREQQQAAAAEELRLKEKQEFEERLKAAEETHALEQAIAQEKAAQSSQRGYWSMLGWRSNAQDESDELAQPSRASLWGSWLGWGSSSGPKSDADKKES